MRNGEKAMARRRPPPKPLRRTPFSTQAPPKLHRRPVTLHRRSTDAPPTLHRCFATIHRRPIALHRRSSYAGPPKPHQSSSTKPPPSSSYAGPNVPLKLHQFPPIRRPPPACPISTATPALPAQPKPLPPQKAFLSRPSGSASTSSTSTSLIRPTVDSSPPNPKPRAPKKSLHSFSFKGILPLPPDSSRLFKAPHATRAHVRLSKAPHASRAPAVSKAPSALPKVSPAPLKAPSAVGTLPVIKAPPVPLKVQSELPSAPSAPAGPSRSLPSHPARTTGIWFSLRDATRCINLPAKPRPKGRNSWIIARWLTSVLDAVLLATNASPAESLSNAITALLLVIPQSTAADPLPKQFLSHLLLHPPLLLR